LHLKTRKYIESTNAVIPPAPTIITSSGLVENTSLNEKTMFSKKLSILLPPFKTFYWKT